MADDFWFKFYAREFLTDRKIDRLSDGAVALLVRVWCVCCTDGDAPRDGEELARRTMRRYDPAFVNNLAEILSFFEVRGDRLVSPRMERERWLSERGRKGAKAANARPHGFVKQSAATSGAQMEAPLQAPQGSGTTSGAQSHSQKLLHTVSIEDISSSRACGNCGNVECVPAGTHHEQPQPQPQNLFHEGQSVSIRQAAEHAQTRLLALRKTQKKPPIGFQKPDAEELAQVVGNEKARAGSTALIPGDGQRSSVREDASAVEITEVTDGTAEE
jgi:hypothetical protein